MFRRVNLIPTRFVALWRMFQLHVTAPSPWILTSLGLLLFLDLCPALLLLVSASKTVLMRSAREGIGVDKLDLLPKPAVRKCEESGFLELTAALEPGTKPKCDKTAILTDAIWVVNMLHEETSRLKEQNVKWKEKINELKSEKNELRAEKQRLKADKEDIEKRIKALGAHQRSFQYHPTAMPVSYAIPYQRVGTELVPFMNNPHVYMCQFVPQTVVDTSQDHVLHPPVA